MNAVLSPGPFGPETSSTQDPTASPSALGRGRRVAVVGGSGFSGRQLVADLLRGVRYLHDAWTARRPCG
jgi:hypothetical protein